MKKLREKLDYFTNAEKLIWLLSVAFISVAFITFDGVNYLNFAVSLVGVTSLIFNAKGNPFGLVLMIIFGIIYGWISYTYSYFGEVITYVGMTVPMSVWALVSWLRHPHEGNRAEVEVSAPMPKKERIFLCLLTVAVTAVFCYILSVLGTANLLPSTVSVTTSFAAVYLTARRSPYFALAYACNDAVLIVLWVLASIEDSSYISVVVCFVAFLVNDVYGFINWRKMQKSQREARR